MGRPERYIVRRSAGALNDASESGILCSALVCPAREVLFAVVPHEDKYKAKSSIDTVVYRLGDQVGAWSYAGLGALSLAMTGVSVVAVPISILWLVNSLWLGRKQKALKAAVLGVRLLSAINWFTRG